MGIAVTPPISRKSWRRFSWGTNSTATIEDAPSILEPVERGFKLDSPRRGRCLFGVKSAALTACRSLPVFSHQRTLSGSVDMSQTCQRRICYRLMREIEFQNVRIVVGSMQSERLPSHVGSAFESPRF